MKKVPITLVTGFLGSGKTSLINHIIKKNTNLKIGAILNEFGDIALESNFIKSNDEEVIELPNGCMCCVAKKDFVGALDKIMEYNPNTDYILIEASGISDPLQILLTFYSPILKEKFRLDSILCVVDALNFDYIMDNYDIASEQIATSDILLLSKTKDVETKEIERIKSALSGLNNKAPVFIADQDLSLELIIDTFEFDYNKFKNVNESVAVHTHSDIDDLFFSTEKFFDYNKLNKFFKSLGKNIVRAKGFVQCKNSKDDSKKYLIQYVAGRLDLSFEEWKDSDLKQSSILFIGKDLDKDGLVKQLEGIIVG